MNFLKIGFIRKPHGLKGELKILPLTGDISRFKKISYVYLLIDNEYLKEELQSVKISNNYIIIKLKDYNSIDDVKKYSGIYIFIEKNNGIPLKKGEYYSQDLIGCSFFYKGKKIGIVVDFDNLGASDVFFVKYKNKEIVYPFLKKYIKKIDIENKLIEINQFEGFFD